LASTDTRETVAGAVVGIARRPVDAHRSADVAIARLTSDARMKVPVIGLFLHILKKKKEKNKLSERR